MTIQTEHLQFLKELSKNNNREWFSEQKANFDRYNKEVKLFFKEVNDTLSELDSIEKYKPMRIYRDVRFSKDKSPYKTQFSCYFGRATAALRGGYYMSISPGSSFVGGGFYSPNAEDLLRIRKEFEQNESEIREILSHLDFKKTFGELKGSALKTSPRGFSSDHQAIDLIRKKQFYVAREFSDSEVLNPNFLKEVIYTFQVLRPYFDFMSEVLTTDLNGESILSV